MDVHGLRDMPDAGEHFSSCSGSCIPQCPERQCAHAQMCHVVRGIRHLVNVVAGRRPGTQQQAHEAKRGSHYRREYCNPPLEPAASRQGDRNNENTD
jgi:hypothetical protein